MASTRKRLEDLTAGLSIPDAVVLPKAATVAATGFPPARPAAPPAAPAGAASAALAPAFPPAVAPEASGAAAASAVETRFPPAQSGGFAPRTGPGQMLAFRGQMQAVEGELSSLRDRLREYEGSLPTRKLDPKTILPTKWANRHSASFGNAEFAGLKADIEQAGGNVQPILVRPLADKPGQYELVFGHRRHRACLELGIPVLASIWTDELSDAELFAAMDRENRERADLTPYEQGVMYQRALEENLFPTQRQLAEKLGVSHTWVRKAMSVAQLPQAVIECFRSPLEVQHRHAQQLNAAMDVDRRGVLKKAEKIRGLKLAPAVVVARLLGQELTTKSEKISILSAGKTVGTCTRAADGSVSISLPAGTLADVPHEALSVALSDALARVKGLG